MQKISQSTSYRQEETDRWETTGQLNELIAAAIPAKIQKKGGHPSKRTFQALRIECNRELEVLRDSIDGLIELLNPGGRLCISPSTLWRTGS